MPTDLLTVIQRRAAERRQESAAVLLLPTLMAVITVLAVLVSPTFAATFRTFGLF